MKLRVQCLFSTKIITGGVGVLKVKKIGAVFEYIYVSKKRLVITHSNSQKILKLARRKPLFWQVHNFLCAAFKVPNKERISFKPFTTAFFKLVLKNQDYYDNVPIATVLQRSIRFPVDSAHAQQSRFLHLFGQG